MAFKSLPIMCFTALMVVSTCAIRSSYDEPLPTREHEPRGLAYPLPKRQQWPLQNTTTAPIISPTTPETSFISGTLSPTTEEQHTTPASQSESVCFVASTPAPTPSVVPKGPSSRSEEGSGTAHNGDALTSTAIVNSANSHTSKYEHQSLKTILSITLVQTPSITSIQKTSSTLISVASGQQLSGGGQASSSITSMSVSAEPMTTPERTPAGTSAQVSQVQATSTHSEVFFSSVGVRSSSRLTATALLQSNQAEQSISLHASEPGVRTSLIPTSTQNSGIVLSGAQGTVYPGTLVSRFDGSSIMPTPIETLLQSASQLPTPVPTPTSNMQSGRPHSQGPVSQARSSDNGMSMSESTIISGSGAPSVSSNPISKATDRSGSMSETQMLLASSPVLITYITVPSNTFRELPLVRNSSVAASSTFAEMNQQSVGLSSFSLTSSLAIASLTATVVVSVGSSAAIASSANPTSTDRSISSSYRALSATLAAPAVSGTIFPASSFPPALNYTFSQTTRTSAVFEPTTALGSHKISSTTSVSLTTATADINSTALTPQLMSRTASAYQNWNNTSFLGTTRSRITTSDAFMPTGVVASPNKTQLEISQITSTPVWSNSTSLRPSFNIALPISSNTQADVFISTIASRLGASITSAIDGSGYGATRTMLTTFRSTASATGTLVAAPLPPLTTPQTAVVAVAGAAGLLLAVVAAIYIARRYRAKQARRTSTGSIYPKVAYLYDPPANGEGSNKSAGSPKPGRSSDMPLLGSNLVPPPGSSNHGQYRHSTGTVPMRYSDPGNPFRDPEDPLRGSRSSNVSTLRAPANAAAALSAAIAGYTATPQKSPCTTEFPNQRASHDLTLSPVTSDAISPSSNSILSEIAAMAYNPHAFPNATSQYRPLSPYGRLPNHSLPCLRESSMTDPFADTFEHDLLLQVDPRSETPDAVILYAPPSTPRPMSPIKALTKKSCSESRSSLVAAKALYRPSSRLANEKTTSPDPTVSPPERFSLAYDTYSSTTFITPARAHQEYTVSPLSSPPEPIHRGWDDIKRYSDDKVVPPVLPHSPSLISLSPPLRNFSPPPPNKMRSLPQLRRKEPALAGSGQTLTSNTRLPLTVKIPFIHHRNLGCDSAGRSQFPKLNEASVRSEDDVKSPTSTITQSVHSIASLMHKKKSVDFEFACAGV